MRGFDQRIATPICTTSGFSLCAMRLMTLCWLGGCGAVLTGIPELDTADGRVFPSGVEPVTESRLAAMASRTACRIHGSGPWWNGKKN